MCISWRPPRPSRRFTTSRRSTSSSTPSIRGRSWRTPGSFRSTYRKAMRAASWSPRSWSTWPASGGCRARSTGRALHVRRGTDRLPGQGHRAHLAAGGVARAQLPPVEPRAGPGRAHLRLDPLVRVHAGAGVVRDGHPAPGDHRPEQPHLPAYPALPGRGEPAHAGQLRPGRGGRHGSAVGVRQHAPGAGGHRHPVPTDERRPGAPVLPVPGRRGVLPGSGAAAGPGGQPRGRNGVAEGDCVTLVLLQPDRLPASEPDLRAAPTGAGHHRLAVQLASGRASAATLERLRVLPLVLNGAEVPGAATRPDVGYRYDAQMREYDAFFGVRRADPPADGVLAQSLLVAYRSLLEDGQACGTRMSWAQWSALCATFHEVIGFVAGTGSRPGTLPVAEPPLLRRHPDPHRRWRIGHHVFFV